jgi:hypothetical protein
MPAPLRHPTLALVGMAVIAVLAVQLLREAITLEAAAMRAVLTVVVLVVVDRIAVPLGRALVSAPPARRAGTDSEAEHQGR